MKWRGLVAYFIVPVQRAMLCWASLNREPDIMSAVLAIAHIDIHDQEAYAQYGAPFMDILAGFDAKLLGFADGPEILEGAFAGTRLVVLEFASREELDRWYRSEAYQAILPHRLAASDGHVWIVPKLDLPTSPQ